VPDGFVTELGELRLEGPSDDHFVFDDEDADLRF
jgi:hypothetical protein